MLHSCAAMFPRMEGGIQVLACLSLSIQTVGSIFRAPWPTKQTGKNSAKSEFDEFTSVGKSLNYISLDTFVKVKISTNLSITIMFYDTGPGSLY